MTRIALSDAVERWRQTPGAPSNAYSWYRQSAQRQGTVYFGYNIKAHKNAGQWTVDGADFEGALSAFRQATAGREEIQARIEAHDFRGESGVTYQGSDGGYTVNGRYAFVWSDYQIARRKSDGSWYCRACGKIAGDPPNCTCGKVVRSP